MAAPRASSKLEPRTKNLAQLEFGLDALKRLWEFHARLGSRGKSATRHLARMRRLESRIDVRESWIAIARTEAEQ